MNESLNRHGQGHPSRGGDEPRQRSRNEIGRRAPGHVVPTVSPVSHWPPDQPRRWSGDHRQSVDRDPVVQVWIGRDRRGDAVQSDWALQTVRMAHRSPLSRGEPGGADGHVCAGLKDLHGVRERR